MMALAFGYCDCVGDDENGGGTRLTSIFSPADLLRAAAVTGCLLQPTVVPPCLFDGVNTWSSRWHDL